MESYFVIDKRIGVSQFQLTTAYLGGSAIQTIVDNPVTAYRQLVQQYAKGANGYPVDPKIAMREANAVFISGPLSASLSGLVPRLIGVGLKRVPKFCSLLGITSFTGSSEPGLVAATGASIVSAPFINPIRMIEKQQRVDLKTTGKIKSVWSIVRESAQHNFKPLFRGTVPLMGHSLASAVLGLVGQPKLQKKIESELSAKGIFGRAGCNLIASSIVSPMYVIVTNPLSRLEVIMQTAEIKGKHVSISAAVKEMALDARAFGMRGLFRGNAIGIFKAILSLSLFHEGRIWCTEGWRMYNAAQTPNKK